MIRRRKKAYKSRDSKRRIDVSGRNLNENLSRERWRFVCMNIFSWGVPGGNRASEVLIDIQV